MVNFRKINEILMISVILASVPGCGMYRPVESTHDTKPVQEETAEASAETPSQETYEETATDTEETAPESGNLIPGADFASKNSSWGIYTQSGGSADFDVSNGKLKLHIISPGAVGHAVQLYCDGFEMLEGGKYHFSAKMSSDVDRKFEWRIQINGSDYHPYARLEEVEISQDPKEITFDFEMKEPSDPAPRMCFNLGDETKAQGLSEHNVFIEEPELVLTNPDDVKKPEISGELMDINVNQVGYRPADKKRAVVRITPGDLRPFDVIDEKNKSVFSGVLTEGIDKGLSGDTVAYADFSAVNTPGRYRIRVDGIGESYDFTIGDGVYDDALKDTVRMLYLQRCGCELFESLAGDFAHRACHTDEARIYGSKRFLEVTGGWHDAGDYGRYTVPGTKAVADLLLAYEMFPQAFSKSLDIPESGNGVPDVLNEARYELEWLLKMQAPDGGVYHKVTGLNFDGVVKSDECTEPLYILPESKTATADFAAVMYMASRVYKDFDEEFAARCLDAADKAVDVYVIHADDVNYSNPADVLTGEYGDKSGTDEFLWALCEGYKTTGDRRFEKLMEKVDPDRIGVAALGWANMSGYAFYAYVTTPSPMKAPIDIRGKFFEWCDGLKNTALTGESYGCTITDEYPWGSNMTVANNGMALLMAYDLTGNGDYRLAAQRQLDYLFGTNCLSYCFLTGYGTKCPVDPHHRPSQAVGKCMKGMLVGGPDSSLEDPYAKAVLSGLPKARCYVDNAQTYSCNEVTIYWNTPLAFLLAGLK